MSARRPVGPAIHLCCLNDVIARASVSPLHQRPAKEPVRLATPMGSPGERARALLSMATRPSSRNSVKAPQRPLDPLAEAFAQIAFARNACQLLLAQTGMPHLWLCFYLGATRLCGRQQTGRLISTLNGR